MEGGGAKFKLPPGAYREANSVELSQTGDLDMLCLNYVVLNGRVTIRMMICFYLFRVNMSTEPTAHSSRTHLDEQTLGGSTNTPDSSRTHPYEQTLGGSTNTAALLEECILNADHDALQEHLENIQTEQSLLDRCLMFGLQIVQRKEQEMERVAPALQLLCQFGAKWNPDTLLEHQMTPYHLICLSTGDHHELLDLLIQSSERTLLHSKDDDECTALLYAVKNANINCVRILISHGAVETIDNSEDHPIIYAMWELLVTEHSSVIMMKIFDLFLDTGPDIDKAFAFAMQVKQVECMKKLIVRGADIDFPGGYVWRMMAGYGRADLLQCLVDRGIDKNVTDENGISLLWCVTCSGKVKAIRYLLNLGVTVPTYESKARHELCTHCGVDMLVLDDDDQKQRTQDPCMEPIHMDKLKVVQLFEEYGSKSFKCFNSFRLAVISDSVTVVEYLHRKYRHSLNTNYTIVYSNSVAQSDYKHTTLLEEACYHQSIKVIHYLLEHGVSLNKVDMHRCSSALMVAIRSVHVRLIALLICNGADINFRSYVYKYGDVLPFEAALLRDYRFDLGVFYAVELLLVSGCSCGVFSLEEDHKFKARYIDCEIKNLMMKWNVQENNVKPLMQQCRRVILKHLSPRASKMIEKLPLPQCVIKYLGIPELDDIVARYRKKSISCGRIRPKTISGFRFFD